MTEWWQLLLYAFGTATIGYFFARLGANRERKSRERDQLLTAARNILAEVESNLKVAKEPFGGRLLPFTTDMWDVHKGQLLGLPGDLQDALYQFYLDVHRANTLVQVDLHQQKLHQRELDKPYEERCRTLTKKAEKARELLVRWLSQEGAEVMGEG